MTHSSIRIATRRSPLALWQAHAVRQALQQAHPDCTITLVELSTQGDQLLHQPLNKIGGKGLFVKELEQALYDRRADIAVHSVKDVPMHIPDGLIMPVICARETAQDALVSNHYGSLDSLPQGSTLGTSSLRRQSQLLHLRPDLNITWLRGNVGTRLQRLDEGQYDAIVLASAGLIRLNLAQRICQSLPLELCLPAVGQGAIGIECRAQDTATQALIAPLHDACTALCINAERSMNQQLNGSCQVPIAAYAQYDDAGQRLQMRAKVAQPDGRRILFAQGDVPILNLHDCAPARALGRYCAQQLLDQGAQAILEACVLVN